MELFLYREADTVLHRLDARTKILSLLAIFTVALLFSQPALQAGWLAVMLGLAALGRCLPNLKKLWALLLLLFLYCLVLWPLFVKGPLAKTVAFSLSMGLRLDVMVIAGVIVLSTTRVEDRTITPAITITSDRKSTRLNSSHGYISYAVFCLKKKKLEHPRSKC